MSNAAETVGQTSAKRAGGALGAGGAVAVGGTQVKQGRVIDEAGSQAAPEAVSVTHVAFVLLVAAVATIVILLATR